MNIYTANRFNNNIYMPNFSQRKSDKKSSEKIDTNPISRRGEVANLVKTTFIAGLVLAGRLFLEIVWDGNFEVNNVAKKASELVDKNKKGLNDNKKFLCKAGAFVSLLIAGCAGFALLYTAYNAPKIAYKSKINAYTKSKEMDTYIKSNEAERELYSQIADKAKEATPEEKEKLKEQYLKMTKAKNQVPDFVKH